MADVTLVTPAAEDQQRYQRTSIICSGALELGHSRLDCDVIDISIGGAKLDLPSGSGALAPGTAVELELEDEIAFAGRIAWWREGQAGIEFADAPELVAEVLPQVLAGPARQREQRGHLRSAVLWSGEIAFGHETLACRILNISAGGAKLRVERALRPGTELRLSCSRFAEMPARVVWSGEGKMGIAFLEPPKYVLQFIAKALNPIRGS